MTTTLIVLAWILFGLLIVAGLILDLLGLFGNWIILGAMVGAWIVSGFTYFGWLGIGLMAALAVLGEIVEMVAAGYGAKKFGGSKGSMVAALVGCLLGGIAFTPLIPVPLVGTLIGACLGSFIGAALYEYIQMERHAGAAMWTGIGAALGKVAGLFAKLAMGLAMLAVAAFTF